jgi:membrane-associated protein
MGQIPFIKNNFSAVIAFIAIVTFAPIVFAAVKSMFKPKETT